MSVRNETVVPAQSSLGRRSEWSALPVRTAGHEFSLGHAVVHAHGVPTDGYPVLVTNSFVTGSFNVGQMPQNLLPAPTGDAYLCFAAVPALSPGEELLTLRLQPGMEASYRGIGLLAPESRLIEVDPRVGKFGYPYTDPVALWGSRSELCRSGHFVATFPSRDAKSIAASRGRSPLQDYNVGELNDKAEFRDRAAQYGYAMLPGIVIDSVEQALRYLAANSGARHWMKLAHGSGGDLVTALPSNTADGLQEGMLRLRESVKEAFAQSEFEGCSSERYWPRDSFLPQGSRVVIERDARAVGPMLINGSINVLLNHDGSYSIVDYFRQNTGADGSYRGSERFIPNDMSPILQSRIDREAARVFRYAYERGLRGFAGLDYFVVGSAHDPQVFCVELNARPTMSSVPALTAKKFIEKPFYVNVNVTAPWMLRGYDDIQRMLTLDHCDLTQPDNSSGVVAVPLAARTLFSAGPRGENLCIFESPKAKILVCGSSTESCWNVLHALEGRGQLTIG